MPEPILGVTLLAGYVALNQLSREGSAISPEAGIVQKNARLIQIKSEHSQSIFGVRSLALENLRQSVEDCFENNWDGYGALPVSRLAYFRTEQILRNLPEEFLAMEITAETDGEIALDWDYSASKNFSFSIGETDRVSFSWVNGSDRGYGAISLSENGVPSKLLSELKSIMPYAASIRAA